ncbi:hypothetical protein [Allonocardiopsis opalescens]|uniref:Uncharacterized protein n=1 Tax=Allonocardiopsis opalescens TaxID=1144618 RepID=A0A2T0PST8_9ACTN|nr:hypothetical protein [Allonocardiopsis opalescens]PRX91959.1 hypothetical protein CLV72_11232 [Allonocardiopsis opalescens]
MCKSPTDSEREQARHIRALLEASTPVELAARLIQAEARLDRMKRAQRDEGEQQKSTATEYLKSRIRDLEAKLKHAEDLSHQRRGVDHQSARHLLSAQAATEGDRPKAQAPAPQSTTVRQQRWTIPDFAARGTTLWTLATVTAEARRVYQESQAQVGAAPADDAITLTLDGSDLVVSFESHSHAPAVAHG